MQRKPEMGKYLLWQFFHRNAYVRKHLPATKRYSAPTFKEFINRYGVIYIKPVAGSRGRGVLKAWKKGGRVAVQLTTNVPKWFATPDAAIRYIDTQRQRRAYIVQQGIQLARISGRPFDIRVMMQREKPGGKWLYSGMLAKIAGKGSVVTNVALSKGTVMEVKQALKQSLHWNERKASDCVQALIRLSHNAARHFDSYLLYRELGFDIAIDTSGRIWMIEENTGPSHALFAHLKSNLSMYRTIQARWGAYRRAKKK